MKFMHVLEKSGERQLFYAKHAKMCLILIIGVNYVSAFITSAPLFLICCVEAPGTSQGWESRLGRVGRRRGPAGVSLASLLLPAAWPSASLRGEEEEEEDGMFCFVQATGGAGCGRAFAVSPPRGVRRRGCSEGRGAAPTGVGPGAGPVPVAGNCFLSPPTAISVLLGFYQDHGVAVF